MSPPASAGHRSTPFGVGGLLSAYREGTLTPSSVVSEAAARARAASGENEWISVADSSDLEAQLAALADETPDTKPLYGVPFAVKDNIDVAGMRTTAACEAFAYAPERSADCVRRLQEAGAVCVGKTNLDQFATGLVGTRSPFGVVRCAFDGEYVCGGSSSGSAAVVARGVVAFALGTDTAGSGRVPAAFNNVVGLKPTPGRVSNRGVVPACRTLDCVSVFALTAADASRVLAVCEAMEGVSGEPDFHPRPSPCGPALFSKLRVGVPKQLVSEMTPAYVEAFVNARLAMTEYMGAELVEIDFSCFLEVAGLLYDGPWVAERHTVVAPLLEKDPSAVVPVVGGIVDGAKRFSASDAFQGRYRLATLAKGLEETWSSVDLLMVPTAPVHPTIAEVLDAPIRVNSILGSYTNFVNLLGWSALAMPASILQGSGLPFGVTWIAPAGYDAALLNLGAKWQASVTAEVPFGAPSSGVTKLDVSLPDAAPASEKVVKLAVVGAHLTGMPLHYQLVERRARLLAKTQTAASYRLYALAGTSPRKPGLVKVAGENEGCSIEVEVYAMPSTTIGSFLELIPSPLGLGSIDLIDGTCVRSFICEPYGIDGATDVTKFGGWRAYIASLNSAKT